MRLLRAALVLAIACQIGACAAIFQGTHENIPVQSAPSGASVATNPATGTFTTPTTLDLQRKETYVLTFTAAGYSPASFTISSHLQAGYVVADVLLTGLIGVVVDAATGAWYSLHPESATVSLTRTTGMLGPDTIRIEIGDAHNGHVDVNSPVPVHVTVTKVP